MKAANRIVKTEIIDPRGGRLNAALYGCFSRRKALSEAIMETVRGAKVPNLSRISIRVPITVQGPEKIKKIKAKFKSLTVSGERFDLEAAYKLDKGVYAAFFGWNSNERMIEPWERDEEGRIIQDVMKSPLRSKEFYLNRAIEAGFSIKLFWDCPKNIKILGSVPAEAPSAKMLSEASGLLNSIFNTEYFSVGFLADKAASGAFFFAIYGKESRICSITVLERDAWASEHRGGKPSFFINVSGTSPEYRGIGLNSAIHVAAISHIERAYPKAMFRAHARASIASVNRCDFIAGFVPCGKLSNQIIISPAVSRDYPKVSLFETLNVWVRG
jgi:hypothetical protein